MGKRKELVPDLEGRVPREKLMCKKCNKLAFTVNGKCLRCDTEKCGTCRVRKKKLTPAQEEKLREEKEQYEKWKMQQGKKQKEVPTSKQHKEDKEEAERKKEEKKKEEK